ncbi:hypothetical protein [Pseudanabaena sp. FACHB-2040]|uniref:hypothetical protein n=1 Tax=Pseudanabaena sp. FACHB-2040 TaxID=2692859 RepID=UPI00168A0065|nr:hypothetical protein [Pseudanabaena sp. FACHB-2040]MBD2256641.1 hypothetical protein [Pseudanabaena sp. FACHB-2040]
MTEIKSRDNVTLKKLGDLDPATVAADNDLLLIEQGGVGRRVSVAALKDGLVTTATDQTVQGAKTFNGTVKFTNTSQAIEVDTAAGTAGRVDFESAGSLRWSFRKSADAETGSNSGGNLALNRYADNGALMSTPLTVNRATGTITVNNGFVSNGTISVSSTLTAQKINSVHTGTASGDHTVAAIQNATVGDNIAALNASSSNTKFSAAQITGMEEGHGSLKISHVKPAAADGNASALSIDLKGTGTAAKGIFMDATQGGTTGALLDLRNDGIARLRLTATGALVLADDFSAADARLTVRLSNDTEAGLAIRANSATGANLMEFRRASDGAVRTRVDSQGQLVTQQNAYFTGPGLQVGSTSAAYGGGSGGMIGINNATTLPTTNPAGGCVVYAEGGELRTRSSAGVVNTVGDARRIQGVAVHTTTPTNGQVLVYSSANLRYEPSTNISTLPNSTFVNLLRLSRRVGAVETRFDDIVTRAGAAFEEIQMAGNGAVRAYWVRLLGDSIGNVGSGAGFAAAWTQQLFEHLWALRAVGVPLVIQTSAGANTTYGASAAADFTANRRIVLPNYAGRTIIGTGANSGLTTRSLNQTGGAETHLLLTAEMPSHNHGVTDPGHTHVAAAANTEGVGGLLLANVNTGSGSQSLFQGGTNAGVPVASSITGITTNNNGSGTAHNNMSPWAALQYQIFAGFVEV